MRMTKRWIVLIDGEEFPFTSLKIAELSARAALGSGADTKLIEETVMVFKRPVNAFLKQDSFRIDISNRLMGDIIPSKDQEHP